MSTQINHTMLSNGLDFIAKGLAEVNSGKNEELKYGVLHLFAGTLLVMKERLRQEHWTLLFSKIDKLSKKAYEQGDFPGVDYKILLDHLENVLEIKISKTDKDALDELRKIRNKIEHFKFELSPLSVKAISGRVLLFTVDFISENFDVDEFSEDEEALFDEIKESAREFKEYIEPKLKSIHDRAAKEKRDVFHCPSCFLKSLVREDSDFVCGICEVEGPDLEEVIDTHMDYELGMSSYSAAKDGYDLPIHNCRECGDDALVPLDQSAKKFICVSCGDQVPTEHLHHCARCGGIFYCTPQDAEEGAGGLCGRCWDEQMAKD